MTPSTLTATEVEGEYRRIEIGLIRDPQEPARETMDQKKFDELCQSIHDAGLIEPIIVRDRNDHFEVVAGHRRTLACRAVGLQRVPCIIRRDETVSDMAIKIHENTYREEMNPVEEARFYLRALNEECGGDVDKLCDMLKRDRSSVEGRILLLSGYPKVVEALEKGFIGIGVSRLLNKIKDPNRLLLCLDMAVQGGANARQVAEWVRDANGQDPILLPPPDPEGDAAAAAAAAQSNERVCIFCQLATHAYMMEPLWAHSICRERAEAADAAGAQQHSG